MISQSILNCIFLRMSESIFSLLRDHLCVLFSRLSLFLPVFVVELLFFSLISRSSGYSDDYTFTCGSFDFACMFCYVGGLLICLQSQIY